MPRLPPPSNEPTGPAPRGPARALTVVLLALATLIGLQFLSASSGADTIRYDELKRYVREGRVDWVQVGPAEIRGAYREGRKPPPAKDAASKEQRPDQFVTGRLDDDTLIPLLEEHRVAFRALPESGWTESLPMLLYLGVTMLFVMMLFGGMARGMGGAATGALSFGKSKGKLFQEKDVSVTFADVAGVDEAKEELQEIIEFLKGPEKYRAIGAKIPKGVLLVGPPGTGKTLLARAVAGEAGVPFISINGSEFVEMFVGVGAARVRDLFQQAEKAAPCIVFIDELDAIGRSRGGPSVAGTHEEREQTLNQMLVELDGFEPKKAVIIMSATNRPEVLDPALLRPGRFDRQILVDRPDRSGRAHILKVHATGVKLAGDVDLEELAARTPGFAGADLANLVNEAALLAARRNRKSVSMREFSDAIDRVVAGLEKKSRLITDHEKRRVAYHEAGHALSSVLSGSEDFVHKISIVPRGLAALGYTMQLPARDRYLVTESELHQKLVGLLGGRAAEHLVFGESSTGARSDLQSATEIARAMVTEYGMSPAVGPVSVGRDRPLFLPGSPSALGGGHEGGERLTDTVDAEVRRLIDEAYEAALALLGKHRRWLEKLATRLMEVEQLEGEELKRLLDDAKKAAEEEGAAA